MFDIGFWELLVIGVVALLVIGPESLVMAAVARLGSTVDCDYEARTDIRPTTDTRPGAAS